MTKETNVGQGDNGWPEIKISFDENKSLNDSPKGFEKFNQSKTHNETKITGFAVK